MVLLGLCSNQSLSRLVNPIQSKMFQKHKNLIQTNRLKIHHTATPTLKDRQNLNCQNILPRKKKLQLQPKTKEQIFSEFNQGLQSPILACSQNLQSVLRKNHLKNQQNLLGYNILHLENKYNISRFELHSLYSMYHTLMRDAKGDILKFKSGFEVILNMIKIAIRPEILQSIFNDQKKLDFQSFIEMYSKIDQSIFKQSIIDYVQILFQGIQDKQRIRHDDIIRIMKNRMTEIQSLDIAKIIYEKFDRRIQKTVSIAEIYWLSNNCETFAKKILRLYSGELQ